MNRKSFTNGSEWLRADFHLHTKSDTEFEYAGESSYFVSKFIDQLVKENISVCAITNHNKFDEAQFRELRKNAEKKGIYLLPGVELSVKDGAAGIHVVVIFNDEWLYNDEQKNYIQSFLDLSFVGIQNYSSSPYPNSIYTLQELFEKLEVYKKDYFFNLAHVDEKNGMFAELHGRNLNAFLNSEAYKSKVLALQKSRSFENLKKLDKEIALVEGSDNKTIDDIGESNKVNGITQKTFIKLGDYNFEALKYSLKDYKNRVCRDVPKIKNSYIKSIEIEGGIFNGKRIDFASGLNSLIGIRGSGKSAMLEIIRWVLGIKLAESAVDKKYKDDLLTYALKSGGKVVLHFVDIHQTEYRIEKIYGQKETIFNVETGECLDCTMDSIFDNVIYYGQNDLSNKSTKFGDDLLLRFVKTDLQLQFLIDNKKQEIKKILYQLKTINDEIEQRLDLTQEIKNIEQKLKYYKDNGLEEKLKKQTDFDSDESKILQARNQILNFSEEIKNLVDNYEISFTQKISGSDFNRDIFDKTNLLYSKVEHVRLKVEENSKEIFAIIEDYNKNLSELTQRKENLKDEFAEIKRELNSETINPDTFLVLKRHLETSKLKLQELDKKNDKKVELLKQLDVELIELNNLWYRLFTGLRNSAESINVSNTNVKIEIIFKGKKDLFLEKLKTVFKGTGIRDSVYKEIAENYLDFIEIYRDTEKLKEYMSESNYVEFIKKFNNELQDLLIFEIEPKVTIFYNDKKINSLSLGQRSSALILFLLAQKKCNLLIIDQPEDDLDNQVIYEEMIKQILELKSDMQFIFATHNPNIPVLGDSEKIISFKQDEKSELLVEIKQGSVDTPLLQDEVVNIMEGGKEAFNKRNTIYTSWDK